MRRLTFDLDVLRGFVSGVELGSFTKAAERLGRSTSAVSAQLKKLEEQAGTPILRKAGRGLALTEAGETMLAYARRLLDLNDEAVSALGGIDLSGWMRFGVQEDFGETVLPEILARFTRAHPNVKIEARVARNADLLERIASAQLDLALAWGGGKDAQTTDILADVPMRWIVPACRQPPWNPDRSEPLPLVVFEAPCLFRTSAVAALDRAGIAWRVVLTSASLAGLWAAISAGLGVTLRTGFGLPASVVALDAKAGLPMDFPALPLTLHRAQTGHSPVAQRLIEIMRGSLAEHLTQRNAA